MSSASSSGVGTPGCCVETRISFTKQNGCKFTEQVLCPCGERD
jgi:hypothetical protein